MGALCPKPSPLPFSEVIQKIDAWHIVETPAFVLMASSFLTAHSKNAETIPYFARGLLIIAGLADIAEHLDDAEITCAALILLSRR